MVELELVGLGEDGTHLVLADAAGDEFTVPLDSRLRAVVRDDVRTGTLETSMESAPAKSAPAESTLRPRDIQARIRAGESPEAVAEIAQVPVQRILTYAVPVMAERSHMADRAQRSAVRRRHAEGPGTMLGDAVAERLREDRVDPQACEWDAWRREDGRWTVTARYRSDEGERTGTFVYDALSRYAVADDDGGRWLVGEKIQEQEPGRVRSSRRRLSAVASEYDAMLFDDEEPTADLTAVADAVGDRPAAAAPAEAPAVTDDIDDIDGTDDTDGTDEGEGQPPEATDDQPTPRARQATEEPPVKQQPKPEKRGRRGRGRASVPSWDEIMFGQSKG